MKKHILKECLKFEKKLKIDIHRVSIESNVFQFTRFVNAYYLCAMPITALMEGHPLFCVQIFLHFVIKLFFSLLFLSLSFPSLLLDLFIFFTVPNISVWFCYQLNFRLLAKFTFMIALYHILTSFLCHSLYLSFFMYTILLIVSFQFLLNCILSPLPLTLWLVFSYLLLFYPFTFWWSNPSISSVIWFYLYQSSSSQFCFSSTLPSFVS